MLTRSVVRLGHWLVLLAALSFMVLACNLGGAATLNFTPSPFPTQMAVATEANSQTPAATGTVVCIPRSDWPSIVIAPGDTLSGIAAQVGSTVDELAKANCISSPAAITGGETLYVPSVPSGAATPSPESVSFPTAINQPEAACNGQNQWFFNFAYGASDSGCPGPVITSQAVGQNFQGGRVYRYDPQPGEQATIYVIYNDMTWATYPDTWTSDQPMNDPSINPPPGWYQPTGAIGKLWREQPGLRDKLGWAYLPEGPFTGRRQSSSTGANYIDHGLRNLVLRLDGESGGTTHWTVVGNY